MIDFTLAKTPLEVAQLGVCSTIYQMGGWLKFHDTLIRREDLTDDERNEIVDAAARAVERYGKHFNLHLKRFALSM